MPEDPPRPVLVYDQIDSNRRKTYLLFGLFTILMAPYFAYLSFYVGEAWLLIMGAAFLTALLAYDFLALVNKYPYESVTIAVLVAFLLGVLTVWWFFARAAARVLRLSGATPVGPQEEPELHRLVENLCIGAGLPQPALYLIETPATNAFAIGRDPEHAGLVVTRGLLDLLERRELEGVLAHALSQIGNYETHLNGVLTAFVRLLWLPYLAAAAVVRVFFRLHWYAGAGCLGMLWIFFFPMILWVFYLFIPWSPAWEGFVDMYREVGIPPALAYFLMFMPFYCLFVAPLAALIVQRLVLRAQPFLHDGNAVLLTRNPGALAQALEKMGSGDNAGLDLSVALAHLCMVNPLSGWRSFFSVHPPVAARIGALVGMSREVTPAMLAEARETGARHAEAIVASAVAKENSLVTLRVEPQSWTQDVTILEGELPLTDMRVDASGKTGSWYVEGTRAGVFQEKPRPESLSWKRGGMARPRVETSASDPSGPPREDLVLEVDGTFLGRAEVPEIPFRSAVLEYDGKSYLLRVEKTFLGGRKYVLEAERGAALGRVECDSGLMRRLTARLPGDLPIHFRLFIIWLILTHWD